MIPLRCLASAVEMLRLNFHSQGRDFERDVRVHFADPLSVARQLGRVNVDLERAKTVIVVGP